MDVIALSQAGFEAAVAPLGTAVTERQLQMLWRVTPEPLIALDGDAAGQRAGLRVADLSLPLIEAGQSLRFAILPEGKDPDDLIRAEGPKAMHAVLDDAKPMLSLLWQREVAGKSFDSPERRAMLDRDLRAVVRRIKDVSLRRHYGEEIARLRAELFGPVVPRGDGGGLRDNRGFSPNNEYGRSRPFVPGKRWQPPPQATSTARSSELAAGKTNPDTVLEQVMLAGLTLHPSLIAEFTDTLESGNWTRDEHRWLAQALLTLDDVGDPEPARAVLDDRLGPEALEMLLAQRHVRISPVTRSDTDGARHCIRDALVRLEARRGADREHREAMEDFEDGADEAMTWRLAQAGRRRDTSNRAADVNDETGREASNAEYYDGLLATKASKKPKKK